jgi:hypothetical protein
MSEAPKSYRVKYEVHCKLQNFFNKEMIVKKCLSALHAKAKLDDYCRNKYGIEYQCIIVTSCTEENNIMDAFDSIFGKDAFGNKSTYNDSFADIIKNLKNKKK